MGELAAKDQNMFLVLSGVIKKRWNIVFENIKWRKRIWLWREDADVHVYGK
jgi:hypothetical protein